MEQKTFTVIPDQVTDNYITNELIVIMTINTYQVIIYYITANA